MASNSSRFQGGRSFSRGDPPPRGSVEWAGVPDMFYPADDGSGFDVYEISFTELDAADRWVKALDRGVVAARRSRGDAVLTAADAHDWESFLARWRPFYGDMTLPGHFNAMLKSNKKQFDDLLEESHRLGDRFAKKGMSAVPVPYMGELLQLLRQVPKKLTAAEMRAKLEAGARCGEKMLDENFSWVRWAVTRDYAGLKTAVRDARAAAATYARSRASAATYSPGDPAYDEFLRRLTKIWVEAAGLYGVTETRGSAASEAADEGAKGGKWATSSILWLLGLAGVSYLGYRWVSSRPREVRLAVPDAYQEEEI